MIDIEYELDCLFSRWLMDKYPEDIHCKEDLIRLEEKGDLREEFNELIKQEV